jgi:hypothetical protein
MFLAVVEVHGHPECVITAASSQALVHRFLELQKLARQDGYHAEMTVLQSFSSEDLTSDPPLL